MRFFLYRWHLWSLIYFCMKFEVSTMLPVHTTAVKRRILKLLSSAWLLVYGRRFSIKIMMSSHPPLSRNMTSYVKLRTYVSTRSKVIGRAKRAPHWGVQSRFRVIYMSVCLSCVVQKSVGGITWAKRAHAQSQYWAVKSYQ